MTLTRAEEIRLVEIGRESIDAGLRTGRPLDVISNAYGSALAEQAATFVTLKIAGRLRGCVGRLEAMRPLVADVAANAFAAAFADPRFPPLGQHETEGLELHISVLGSPEPIEFTGEEELVSQLRVGIDGLILYEGSSRGTFLPVMWKAIPDAAEFVRQLKVKAGWAPDYWSPTVRAERYTAYSFRGPCGPEDAA